MSGLFDAFADVFSGSPRRVFLDAGDRALTGGDILAGTERVAGILRQSGVDKGDRVVVQVEKSLDTVLLYLSCLRLGAAYVPLNSAYRLKELAYFLGDARPKLFVCDPSRATEYAPLADEVGARLLTLGADGGGTLPDFPRKDGGFPDIAIEDVAAIIYTSGTTGRSKGAMLTNGNLLHNAAALREVWQITDEDVLLHTLPLFHAHGLFISLNTVLLAGARARMLPKFEPDAVLAELPECSVFMGVPTYYTRLLADARFTNDVTRNTRLFVSGSAPLLMETYDAFLALTGKPLLERYGMSECGVICANPTDGCGRRGSVGLPLPGMAVRIADDKAEALAGEEIGTLEVRGPSVFSGYWQRPELTESEFRPDGYFITGDLATMDADGFVTLVGRAKDLIITGGLNVYPSEVEAVINAMDGIDESAVIGVPHADFGEAVVAIVCARAGQSCPDEAATIRHLKSELAGFKVPKAVFQEAALPRNAMGKVEKAVLRARYAAHFREKS